MLKFLLVLLLTASAWAQLADSMVLLVVSEQRNDGAAQKLEGELLALRDDLGLAKGDLPLVFMGFHEEEAGVYFERLGFALKDSPVVCVTQWSTTNAAGPARVVNGAIRRSVSVDQPRPALVGLLRDWLRGTGREKLETRLPGPSVGTLEVTDFDLRAHGDPLFLASLTIIFENHSSAPSEPGLFEFRVQLDGEGAWLPVTQFSVGSIRPGAVAKKGTVVSLREFPEMVVDGQVRDFVGRLLLNQETILQGRLSEGRWQQ